MPVLGILACEILELEFALILARDRDIAGITVVEDQHSFGLIESLEERQKSVRRIPAIKGFRPDYQDRLEVLARVMELALHNRKNLLQDALTKAAKEMGRYADAILLGYGLCGNALRNPEDLFADAGAPVFIPMDEDHPVDDCVGLVIGGRERYYGEQCKVAGTFFMIPGWTRHWKKLLKKQYGGFDANMLRRVFGMSNYERSLVIPDAALSVEQMRKNVGEFNEMFGFRAEYTEGNLDMLTNAWERAKRHLLNH